MSEISITRFIPATAARDKVNSVQTANNEGNNSGASLSSSEEEERAQEQEAQEDNAQEEEFVPRTEAASQSIEDMAGDTQLEMAVAKLNEYVQTVQRDIIFGIDSGSDEPSVTVVDRASRKLVRQFGSKEALELAKKVDIQEPLSLFKAQV